MIIQQIMYPIPFWGEISIRDQRVLFALKTGDDRRLIIAISLKEHEKEFMYLLSPLSRWLCLKLRFLFFFRRIFDKSSRWTKRSKVIVPTNLFLLSSFPFLDTGTFSRLFSRSLESLCLLHWGNRWNGSDPEAHRLFF